MVEKLTQKNLKLFLILLLILSMAVISGCVSRNPFRSKGVIPIPIPIGYSESPRIEGELSDDFGNNVKFNESFIFDRNVTFNLESERIRIKIKNHKTGEPIIGARVSIYWNRKEDKPLDIYLFDIKYTNSEGEALFSKSNAQNLSSIRSRYKNNPEIVSRISNIDVFIEYEGTKATLSIQERERGESEESQYLQLPQYTPKPQYSPQPQYSQALEPGDYTNSISMEFMLIPAGEFDMGSIGEDKHRVNYDGPVHHVRISNAFYIGKYEVTQKQWREVMGNNPSMFKGNYLPVENISWYDAQEFIKKLNEIEGTNKYRLPSEAEWEYVARAGTSTKYFFGEDESQINDYAWYDDGSGVKTHLVGLKKPNPWGLYDIYGNVFEWVQDNGHNDYNGAPVDGSAWEREDSTSRVFRGVCQHGNGTVVSYDNETYTTVSTYSYWSCSSANHGSDDPNMRFAGLGFRLVRDF